MSELPDLEDYFDWDGLDWQDYKKDLVDWFKRCKADFPEGEQIIHSPVQSLIFYQWYEKWFSQFIEKGDKDD